MNQKEQQQFFALLRAGLWDTPADAELFYGDTHWETIFVQAARQTVQGLVAKAASTLPTEVQPPSPVLGKARGIVAATIRSHALLNRTLAEAVEMLAQNDIRPILLKGQGVATNYTEPTLRMCGDIDLYIGQPDYRKACHLVREWGEAEGESMESEKHYHFHHAGVTVELHRIAEQLPLPWHNARFQHWTRHHLHGDSLRSVVIEDATVVLPPINFDALYIFNHAWHHLSAGGGIGWRQLCDWVRYLHTFRHEIDRAGLECDLRSFGLWHPWRVFSSIAVDILGLPREEYPFYTDRYAGQAATVVGMIEVGGNFGFFDPARTERPTGYIAGKMHSFRRMNGHYAKLFALFPREVVAICVRYLYVGVRQVIKEVLTSKSPR
ncbi:nucleotidyltransferase family protein [Bacteroides sp.]|uniref:nucleotidyltransferase family protein n=1 Tax=Bacteroides sp. TaxID=29523 RepID=UPI00260434EE|nr:nucleotidyltransferase family protein [Bacteroides sp.]MDD3038790.1 nucleotidyltransferase family protein [Bacteroides sp.]